MRIGGPSGGGIEAAADVSSGQVRPTDGDRSPLLPGDPGPVDGLHHSTPPRGAPFWRSQGATVLNCATNRYPPVGSRRATGRCPPPLVPHSPRIEELRGRRHHKMPGLRIRSCRRRHEPAPPSPLFSMWSPMDPGGARAKSRPSPRLIPPQHLSGLRPSGSTGERRLTEASHVSNGRPGTRDHQLMLMSGPPVQSFPSKRICVEEGCATVLSIYNGTASCSLHEPLGRWVVKHAP